MDYMGGDAARTGLLSINGTVAPINSTAGESLHAARISAIESRGRKRSFGRRLSSSSNRGATKEIDDGVNDAREHVRLQHRQVTRDKVVTRGEELARPGVAQDAQRADANAVSSSSIAPASP